jgi:hypothetical protein
MDMLNIEVPKEIEQENKILAGLNLRQLSSVLAAGILCLMVMYLFHFDVNLALYPCGLIGVGAFFIGWYKKGGLTIERILLKAFQANFFRNETRPYKTKNRYVEMYNEEYARMRRIDMQDPKLAKQIKKEDRHKAKGKSKQSKGIGDLY